MIFFFVETLDNELTVASDGTATCRMVSPLRENLRLCFGRASGLKGEHMPNLSGCGSISFLDLILCAKSSF